MNRKTFKYCTSWLNSGYKKCITVALRTLEGKIKNKILHDVQIESTPYFFIICNEKSIA